MDEKLKTWNIHDIESMDENTARQMASETMRIKGHDIYFVDFGGYFGYSCLVFKDGHYRLSLYPRSKSTVARYLTD